jgi:hypothetical protein
MARGFDDSCPNASNEDDLSLSSYTVDFESRRPSTVSVALPSHYHLKAHRTQTVMCTLSHIRTLV